MTGAEQSLLGFDYGTKKIGVAAGQTVTRTATPLPPIAVRQRRPDWPAIERLIATWRPDILIVGLPLDLDASEGEMARAARRFSRQLQGRFELPVQLVDERLSSREARQRLAERPGSTVSLDSVAAQVILETWFET